MDSQIKQLDICQEWIKAWLMVHGFEQKKTIDFVETFALVIKLMTVRTIISLVVYKGWKMHHLDMISKNTICIFLAQWQNPNPIMQTLRPHHHNGFRVCSFFLFLFQIS